MYLKKGSGGEQERAGIVPVAQTGEGPCRVVRSTKILTCRPIQSATHGECSK